MTGAAPTVVAFDLMDTVIRDPFREALTAATGRPFEEVLAHRQAGAWPRFERGELTEVEFFATFDELPFDAEAFHAARRLGYGWMPGMAELLDDLAGAVVRVAATNYPVWIDELTDGLLRGRFEHVVASHHVAARKPDPDFYARLCERIDAVPSAVLLVDDRADNVEGAAAAGLRAHRFRDAGDLRVRLRAEGIAV